MLCLTSYSSDPNIKHDTTRRWSDHALGYYRVQRVGLKVFVKSLLLSALSRFLSLFGKLSIRAKIGHKV